MSCNKYILVVKWVKIFGIKMSKSGIGSAHFAAGAPLPVIARRSTLHGILIL
jgi:hypothetical protein